MKRKEDHGTLLPVPLLAIYNVTTFMHDVQAEEGKRQCCKIVRERRTGPIGQNILTEKETDQPSIVLISILSLMEWLYVTLAAAAIVS